MKEKNDFPMLNNNIVYFDNAATSLKPKCVINKLVEYYTMYSANSHRGDYDISFKVDDEIDNTRILIKDFINAKRKEEIIFTKNTTESLNMIVFGFFYYYLKDGDEVILSNSEHASNILPWFMLSIKRSIKIVFLDSIHELESKISEKTKVISLAQVTNVYGEVRGIKKISTIAHKNNIMLVVDAAQSAPHMKIDVQDLDADFLAFSAHKMCGPMGVGVLYGKYKLLNKMMPIYYGGAMNKDYDYKSLKLSKIPDRFEAGTQNIGGIIAFGEAIKYINNYGIYNIERHIKYLKRYLIKELRKIPYIKIYNENYDGSTVIINVDGILSGDLGLYLNSKKICVRSGKHCARMINNKDDTVRISLYFYNTYEEIDYLIEVLKDKKSIYEFANY